MRWSRYLLYPLMLPTDIVGWLVMWIIVRPFWGKSLVWSDGVLLCELRPDSWAMQTWYKRWGGTTIGHAIMVAPNQAASILVHERVHVMQLETSALASAVMALLAVWQAPWAALVIWALGPTLVYLAGMLSALCYGLDPYRGNPAETAAYDHASEAKS